MKRALTITAAAAIGLLFSGAAMAQTSGETYTAQMTEINGSSVSGTATVRFTGNGNEANVSTSLSGLADGLPHAQHIHGDVTAANECPDQSADTDGDGVISTAEGLASYGGIDVSLTTNGDTSADSGLAVDRFPVGNTPYSRTIDLPSDVAGSLEDLHIVVHGVDFNNDGMYNGDAVSSLDDSLPLEATAPAACGQLALTSAGSNGVQTGGGGTGTDTTNTALLAVGLAGAAAAAGVGLRRRRRSQA